MSDAVHSGTLEKAIQKAIDGGWRQNNSYRLSDEYFPSIDEDGIITARFDITPEGKLMASAQPRRFSIFDHQFAQCLWGEKLVSDLPDSRKYHNAQDLWWGTEDCKFDGAVWQYHLQQLVISEDPLAYLEQNI